MCGCDSLFNNFYGFQYYLACCISMFHSYNLFLSLTFDIYKISLVVSYSTSMKLKCVMFLTKLFSMDGK
jgi:hypothetical protein